MSTKTCVGFKSLINLTIYLFIQFENRLFFKLIVRNGTLLSCRG